METIVPSPDVLALPAPVWLFEVLLVFTFICHVLPMNFLFGGGLLAAFSHARRRKETHHAHLAQRIYKLLPVVIAFTVTLGVAPLLFVQVLYGQLVYSSSILMANAWFFVIPLVMLGYYLAYLLRFRWEALGDLRGGLTWLMALIFAFVGFIYTNNFSLLLRPESWFSHYFASLGSGAFNWSDPSMVPRYLHMLTGALAVAGLWIMLIGARGKSGDQEWSRWAVTYGAKVFLYVTLANVLVGLWFLAALPKPVMMIFMGQHTLATALFGVSFILTILAWFFVWRATKKPEAKTSAFAGTGLLLIVLVCMAIMRQQVRRAALEPHFRIESLAAEPQWGIFALFACTLVVGLIVVAWLVRVALRAKPAEG